jgi:PAS domain S-box-containing protein
VITDLKGNITWVNPAFTELTGYPTEYVIGKNPRILRSEDHNNEFYEEMWKTILAGKKWHQEIRNKRADGSLYTEDIDDISGDPEERQDQPFCRHQARCK